MASYQLKLMLSTSIPGTNDYIELTSDILLYNPKGRKKLLSKYPYFSPTSVYPRKEIQNLPYAKRIETFFNKEKFKQMVLQSSSVLSQTDMLREIEKDLPDDEDETEGENSKKKLLEKEKVKLINSNFEFTIQTLLCTGFPVNNYFQSMEFYDSKIRTKGITLKGSTTGWFPFLPLRFDRMFSHLKIGNSVYTTVGVIWINDALNHPKYLDVLEPYKLYKDEQMSITNPIDDRSKPKRDENDESIQLTEDYLITDILYREDIWKTKANIDITKYSRSKDQEIMNNIYNSINSLINKIRGSKDKDKDKPETGITKPIEDYDDDSNTDQFKELAKKFNLENKIEQKPKKKEHNLVNILLQSPYIVNDLGEGELKNIMGKIVINIDTGISKNQDIHNDIKSFVRSYKRENISGLSVTYGNDLLSFFTKLKDLYVKEKTYEYIINENDFSDDQDKEKIEEIIRKEFPNYSGFSSSLRELGSSRVITNTHWKEEALKFVDSKKVKLKEKTMNDVQLFPTLMECQEKNKNCKKRRNPKATEYLNVGIDQLKTKTDVKKGQSSTLYEGYVQVNVVEGEITNDNYKELKCSYLDYSLGGMFSRMKKRTKENYIVKNKIYFSLKDKIEEVKKQKEDKIKKIEEAKQTRKKAREQKTLDARRTRKKSDKKE